MRHRAIEGCFSAIVAALMAAGSFARPAWAEELHGSGREALPCNALCRAWLGIDGPGNAAVPEPMRGVGRGTAPVRRADAFAPAPKREPARAEARTARAAPRPGPRLEPRRGPEPEATAAKAARRPVPPSKPTVEFARAAVPQRVPLPAARPAAFAAPRVATAGEPPSAGSALSSSRPPSLALAPQAPASPVTVTVAAQAPPAPMPPTPMPPRRGADPDRASAAADPEPVPEHPVPVDRPPAAPKTVAAPDAPAAPSAPAPEPTRMAALPPPAAAIPEPPTAGEPEGDRTASLPPVGPLSVKVGRVGAEGGNTGVHVVVINVLPGDVRDVDVRCEARDAQGMQVGDAQTRIASIARADVAFGTVLFPSELTPANSRFTCAAARFADPITKGP